MRRCEQITYEARCVAARMPSGQEGSRIACAEVGKLRWPLPCLHCSRPGTHRFPAVALDLFKMLRPRMGRASQGTFRAGERRPQSLSLRREGLG